jgi:hypothetical protein
MAAQFEPFPANFLGGGMMPKKGTITIEGFTSMLEFMQEHFVCLRSGECCFNYGVGGVPGYDANGRWTGNLAEKGYKPERQNCRHLEPARIVDGAWRPAACGIHDSEIYPEECRQFTLGVGKCALGRAIWNHRQKVHPDTKLPDGV